MARELELQFRDGALWWQNGTRFVMPSHVAVKVGEHEKGWNKTIGRTCDGKKKRFWFGRGDRSEAERKAAHVLNVWELRVQRCGEDAAWDDETLKLVARGVHIDKLVKLQGQIDAATASVSSDSATLELVRADGAQSRPVESRSRPQPLARTATLYDAINAYKEVVKAATGSAAYRRRRLETADDLKHFRADCDLREVDRVWLEGLTNHIKARPARKRKDKIGPGTVKTYLQHWRQFFGWVDAASESDRFGGWESPKRWEKLFKVKLDAIRTKRERDDSADGPEQITVAEIVTLLKHAKHDGQRTLILTALFTGQGQNELAVARRDEFDLTESTFKHRRNKTGQLGVYWLPDELVALLRKYFEDREPIGDNLAFSTRLGRPLVTDTSDSVGQWFRKVRDAAKAAEGEKVIRDGVSFYWLRRYFGHRARMLGGNDLQEAALSHSAKTVGQRHYSNFRDFEKVADVGRAIQAELIAWNAFNWQAKGRGNLAPHAPSAPSQTSPQT